LIRKVRAFFDIDFLINYKLEKREIQAEIIGEQELKKFEEILERVPEESKVVAYKRLIKQGELSKYRLRKLVQTGNRFVIIFKQERKERGIKKVLEKLRETKNVHNFRAGDLMYVGSYIYFIPNDGSYTNIDKWLSETLSDIPDNYNYDIVAVEAEATDKTTIPHGKKILERSPPFKTLLRMKPKELFELLKISGYTIQDLIERATLDFFIWNKLVDTKVRKLFVEKHDGIIRELNAKKVKSIWDVPKLETEELAKIIKGNCRLSEKESLELASEIQNNLKQIEDLI